MPLIFDQPLPRSPNLTVASSVAVELEWVLASAGQYDFRRDHAALATMYEGRPELRQRVTSFWDSDVALRCPGFLELTVVAHAGGLLFSPDARELLDRLGELCRSAPRDLPLASETTDDRAALLDRLARLRSSAGLRRRYVHLVTDVWEAVEAIWLTEGRPAVEAAVADRLAQISRGVPWPQIIGREASFDGLVQRLVDGLGPQGQLAVVPAFFTHKGLLVDLPGLVLVGVQTGSDRRARVRTELLARRLKTLADPTRLAILDALTAAPRTVGELTAALNLAQPTVSNHVKLLRDAGLVMSLANGPRRELVVQQESVTELLEQLGALLRPTAQKAPDQGAPDQWALDEGPSDQRSSSSDARSAALRTP